MTVDCAAAKGINDANSEQEEPYPEGYAEALGKCSVLAADLLGQLFEKRAKKQRGAYTWNAL